MASSDEEQVEIIYPPFQVRVSDMDNALMKKVIYEADQILQKTEFEKDAAAKIVEWVKGDRSFNGIGEGEWQCVIGKNFGASLTFDSSVLTFFDILGPVRKSVLLFKSGGYN